MVSCQLKPPKFQPLTLALLPDEIGTEFIFSLMSPEPEMISRRVSYCLPTLGAQGSRQPASAIKGWKMCWLWFGSAADLQWAAWSVFSLEAYTSITQHKTNLPAKSILQARRGIVQAIITTGDIIMESQSALYVWLSPAFTFSISTSLAFLGVQSTAWDQKCWANTCRRHDSAAHCKSKQQFGLGPNCPPLFHRVTQLLPFHLHFHVPFPEGPRGLHGSNLFRNKRDAPHLLETGFSSPPSATAIHTGIIPKDDSAIHRFNDLALHKRLQKCAFPHST